MIPLVAIAIVWPILVDIFSSPRFNRTKKFITPAVICSAVFAIFIAPLAYYFYMHPRSFVGRSGQVSIFNPDLNHGDLFGTFVKVFLKSVGAYFWNGDLNWRHNISGKPFLSIIISPFFGVGLIMATTLAARYAIKPLKYKTDWKYFVLAGWFWAMMLPTVTTAESIPHGLRSIGTIPSVFILSAVGLMAIFNFVSKVYNLYWEQIKGRERKLITNARNILAIVFVVSLISQAYIHCFVVAANDTKYFYAFRSDLTTVSEYLKEHGNKTNTYLILDKFSAMTVDYMTTADSRNPENPKNNPYKQLNPEDSWKLTNLKFGDQLVFAQSSLFDIEKFKQCHPEAQLIREDRNKFNQIVMTVYVIGK